MIANVACITKLTMSIAWAQCEVIVQTMVRASLTHYVLLCRVGVVVFNICYAGTFELSMVYIVQSCANAQYPSRSHFCKCSTNIYVHSVAISKSN